MIWRLFSKQHELVQEPDGDLISPILKRLIKVITCEKLYMDASEVQEYVLRELIFKHRAGIRRS